MAYDEELVGQDGASRMEMRGREMNGWVRVTSEAVADEDALARWVARGVEYAGSLPPK